MRTLAIAVCIAGLLLAGGCQPKKKTVVNDAGPQRRLDESRRMMEQRESTLSQRRQPANVVPASTTSGEMPPAHLSGRPGQFSAGADGALEMKTSRVPADRLSKSSSPNEVCEAFLAALEKGDSVSASHMLTDVAQLETARANLVLESPGTPETLIELLPARYATLARQVAQVDCLLRLPGQTVEPVRLTWMMRQQPNGWKISGMAIPLESGTGHDLLSFENPVDLARIQASVEEQPMPETNPPAAITASRDRFDSRNR